MNRFCNAAALRRQVYAASGLPIHLKTCLNFISLKYPQCQLFNDVVRTADVKIPCQAETSPVLFTGRK
jgi:hypothetical protein